MAERCGILAALFVVVTLLPTSAFAQRQVPRSEAIPKTYTKKVVMIPMRDGVSLYTSIYSPKDTSKQYPFLMMRTPYSCQPYGNNAFPYVLGPSVATTDAGYIFVYQDVRGCYMSEGKFTNMTPHIDDKKSKTDVDESSDTYDTVEWLINNIPNNNGKVGQYGISYPGFYSAAGMIDAHPALKAVSPQAPIADWFFDDFRHHGAIFLPHGFNFLASFGRPRPEPTTSRSWDRFQHGTKDGYQFFLDIGPLKNADQKYFHGDVEFWNTLLEHANYDDYWKARNLLPHLKHVAPAVMTVGGWFDAEDLYGACQTYRAIEKQNPDIFNIFVMGPWVHGGWAGRQGDHIGNVYFGADYSEFFQTKIELPFFEHFLKGEGKLDLPEAYVFETGANNWRTFNHWPPRDVEKKTLHFHAGNKLSFDPDNEDGESFDEFVSDPAKPVPFTEEIAIGMTREYMTDDQRFAARRPDVLAYETETLQDDVTLAGPLESELWVSTSGTDSDWVVKLIDVFPPDASDPKDLPPGRHMSGYQMMVRSEIIRGRFRNSNEKPEPFVANQPTKVPLELQDVLHTFKKGHKIMVQVQSTWFPLADRNPQKYVDNVAFADEKDFIKATQRVYRGKQHPTAIKVGVLPAAALGSPQGAR
jgi:putative CocE/NonD family hydrolase